MVEIQSGRNTNSQYEIDHEPLRRNIRFADYVDMVFGADETNDFYLTARNEFFRRPGADKLLSDIELFPEYLRPSSGDGLMLWFGPKGTVTPLHFDLLNIFMSQVIGRKRVILVPSNEIDLVYNHQGVYSLVDSENPDYNRFPKFRDATVMEVELAPGEVLFLPVGWWHQVRSLDPSITISVTNFIFPNDYQKEHVVLSSQERIYGASKVTRAENLPEEPASDQKVVLTTNPRASEINSVTSSTEHEALYNTCAKRLNRAPGVTQLATNKVQLFTIDNFLTNDECDQLIAVMEREKLCLRPSTVTRPIDGYRTSLTSDLSLLNYGIIALIDQKIASTLGVSLSYSEGIQAQKYEVFQEFKPHTDYFEPNSEEYEENAKERGNRTWTFMVYLNDTAKGGATQFVNLNLKFFPEKGKAVVWNNLYADG